MPDRPVHPSCLELPPMCAIHTNDDFSYDPVTESYVCRQDVGGPICSYSVKVEEEYRRRGIR